MSGCFFLKHGVLFVQICILTFISLPSRHLVIVSQILTHLILLQWVVISSYTSEIIQFYQKPN